MPRYVAMTAPFAAGESLSSVIDCSTGAPVFLHMPHEWTSARLTFQVSADGSVFNDLFADNAGWGVQNRRQGTRACTH